MGFNDAICIMLFSFLEFLGDTTLGRISGQKNILGWDGKVFYLCGWIGMPYPYDETMKGTNKSLIELRRL